MSNIEERSKKSYVNSLASGRRSHTESSFVNDLGADSLDTVELVMALERNLKRRSLMKRLRKSLLFSKQLRTSKQIFS